MVTTSNEDSVPRRECERGHRVLVSEARNLAARRCVADTNETVSVRCPGFVPTAAASSNVPAVGRKVSAIGVVELAYLEPPDHLT